MGNEYGMNLAIRNVIDRMASVGSVTFSVNWVVTVAAYVVTALALYTIASRRGIHKAWLAWIPVLDVWILGSISDQYRYVVKGENKSKRKILLVLSIIGMVLGFVSFVWLIGFVVSVIGAVMQNMPAHLMLQRATGSLMGGAGLALLVCAFGIVKMIFYYMALYDLYTSCEPQNNVLYLVLSIIPVIATVAMPLFLFLCREKDEGMPPRRENAPESIPQDHQIWDDVRPDNQEPWNNPEE